MPSQLASLYVPSGSSVVAGGWQPPQPVAPWQVRMPAQVVPNGVMIEQLSIMPMLAALQSHAPELGTHCFTAVPPMTMSVQA